MKVKGSDSCGIYRITCGDKSYIGSRKKVNKRINQHKNLLKSGKHPNKNIQLAFSEDTVFEILEFVIVENKLLEIEQWYFDKEKPILNKTLKAKSPTQDPRVAKKVSQSRKGCIVSQETRLKISQTLTGRKLSKEFCENMSKSMLTNPRNFRKVICLTTGEKFDTLRKAAENFNLKETNLHRIINVTHGFHKKTNLTFAYLGG